MIGRLAFPLAIGLAFGAVLSGCAPLSEDDFPMDVTPTPVAEAPTASQDYSAGLDAHSRGDDADARRLWMRCEEESPASASEHLNCLVAIEQLAPPPPSGAN